MNCLEYQKALPNGLCIISLKIVLRIMLIELIALIFKLLEGEEVREADEKKIQHPFHQKNHGYQWELAAAPFTVNYLTLDRYYLGCIADVSCFLGG